MYAAISGGASLPISRRLILMERAVLLLARVFDRLAAPYHRAGIPLLEDLFAPLSSVAAFVPVGVPASAVRAPSRLHPAAVRHRVRAAYRSQGFDGAADVLETELAARSGDRGTDCLVRHLLESAYRLAGLAPEHIRLAQARGLASPRRLLSILLRLHLWGLGPASALDARARPLQARGIRILAQDLPPISPPPGRARVAAVSDGVAST